MQNGLYNFMTTCALRRDVVMSGWGPTNYRKTPQDTARHPQDTARHCKTPTRHCNKGPQERRMEGYYRYKGVWWGGGGGVVTKFFGRTFLLHFCTNCEKTKLGKKL